MVQDLEGMDFSACPPVETLDKQHGRIEPERLQVKTGEVSVEVSYALSSLGPERATEEQIAAFIRNDWHIENRLHYVRDFTCDEDRCRVYVRDLPRNLAALTNTAISIIRGLGRFAFVSEANRHIAAPSQEALDLLLHPLG